MARFTTELKVGLLTLIAGAATVWGILRTDDRPAGALQGYDLVAYFPSAEGIYPSTQVRVAGVAVGAVRSISIKEGKAKVELEMSGEMQLPTDSTAELRSEGVLGDKYVRITPGKGDVLLDDGDEIGTAAAGDGLEALQAEATIIAANVRVVTEQLRKLVEDPALRGQLASTVANLDALSGSLLSITEANRAEIEIVAKNLIELSATLKDVANRVAVSMDKEMVAIRDATRKLDQTLGHVNAIAARIDAGEGTLGRLVNDPTTVDRINSTIEKVDDTLGSITSIQTEVFYDGAAYFGTDPGEVGFRENPLSGAFKNTIGLRVLPRDDYGYIVALTSHPFGDLSSTEHLYPETGGSYTEVVRTGDYRFTFQFMKRWGPAAFRLGVKESSGGVGADLMLARERVVLNADLYDFEFGSWPVLDSTPNLSLGMRLHPWSRVYASAGWENAIFGLRHGYVTGFIGLGFSFDDDDIKWVLSALPLPD